jgi:hypothetical protein
VQFGHGVGIVLPATGGHICGMGDVESHHVIFVGQVHFPEASGWLHLHGSNTGSGGAQWGHGQALCSPSSHVPLLWPRMTPTINNMTQIMRSGHPYRKS